MSRLMRMALEEVNEIKDEEVDYSSNLLNEFKDDIATGNNILLGLENFKNTVSEVTADKEILNKVLDAGYRLAVQGTVYQTNKTSVSMENNENISIESFSNNIKEIVRKIIAFIKESYERIKQFVMHLFNKKQKVEKDISEVSNLVKDKEAEIKTSKAEIIVVEPKPAFNLKTDNTKLLLELAPVKERKNPVIVIPKTISLGKETSIIYPHGSYVCHTPLNSGKYLTGFMYDLERYVNKIDEIKYKCSPMLTALDTNVSDFCDSFNEYIKEPDSSIGISNLKELLRVIKLNYYRYTKTFITSLGNMDLWNRKDGQNTSYIVQISGGYGFQTTFKEITEDLAGMFEHESDAKEYSFNEGGVKQVYDAINFVRATELEDKGDILVNLDLAELTKLADNCSSIYNATFTKNADKRLSALDKTESHKKLLSAFEHAANATSGSQVLPIVNECKKYLLQMDNNLLAINKFDNHVLSVLDKICETERNLIALWKSHNL